MKKIVSVLLALSMCLSLTVPAVAEETYLDEVKRLYEEDGCFYQVTDKEYLTTLEDDDIIETFHGIYVTKKLLNEDGILDIGKVTEDDLEPEISAQNARAFSTEVRKTLGSSYDNVVVVKKIVDPLENTTSSLTYMYMSHQGIVDFAMSDWSGSLGNTINSIVGEWLSSTVVDNATKNFGTYFSAALALIDIVIAIQEKSFKNAVTNLYYAGNKAVVTISPVSRSCAKWSDNYYYTEDATRNGLNITSEYRCFNNRRVG